MKPSGVNPLLSDDVRVAGCKRVCFCVVIYSVLMSLGSLAMTIIKRKLGPLVPVPDKLLIVRAECNFDLNLNRRCCN